MLSIICLGFLTLGFVQSQALGKLCRLQNGKTGICIAFGDCNYAINLVHIKNQRPQHCDGYKGLDPVVCCPMEKSEISEYTLQSMVK